jgi:hypothetical protein
MKVHGGRKTKEKVETEKLNFSKTNNKFMGFVENRMISSKMVLVFNLDSRGGRSDAGKPRVVMGFERDGEVWRLVYSRV